MLKHRPHPSLNISHCVFILSILLSIRALNCSVSDNVAFGVAFKGLALLENWETRVAEVAEWVFREEKEEELKRAAGGFSTNSDSRSKSMRSPPRKSSKRRKDWHRLILLGIILTQVYFCTSETKLF